VSSRTRIHEQLRDALERSGWTYRELARKSELSADHSLLIRKLKGETPLSTREAESLTDTFRRNGIAVRIVWPRAA
jgi:hypothetical protein